MDSEVRENSCVSNIIHDYCLTKPLSTCDIFCHQTATSIASGNASQSYCSRCLSHALCRCARRYEYCRNIITGDNLFSCPFLPAGVSWSRTVAALLASSPCDSNYHTCSRWTVDGGSFTVTDNTIGIHGTCVCVLL